MKNLIILFIIATIANSSNLLTHNIYDRSDRVDVMLSFDSPYEGKIFQSKGSNITTLTLSDLTYDKLVEKNVNSKILQSLTIEPNGENLKVILTSNNAISVIASKTVDGFGLRIRTKPNFAIKTQSSTIKRTNTKSSIETKSTEDLIDGRYITVIIILTIMVLFMLWLKKRIISKGNISKEKSSWLFKSNEKKLPSAEVNVLHQKSIDSANSVVLLEFQNQKYLVMTGNSNLLLDKFSHSDIKDESDFEQAFEDNRKKLDDYLKIRQNDVPASETDDYRSKLERV